MQEVALVASGLIIGAIIGLTGVGGGSLMTPLLILGFGVTPATAVGTDLLFAAITKFGGTLKLALSRQVAWRAVAALCAGAIPATLLTTVSIQWLGPSSPETESLIRHVLGGALFFTAIASLYKVAVSRHASTAALQIDHATPRHWALPTLFGAAIGVIVTLTSVGAGAIGVAVLLLIYPHLAPKRVVAVDLAYAVPLTAIAGLGHAHLGNVDWHLLTLLVSGSLLGIWLGSRLLGYLNPLVTRGILSTLLAAVGIKLMAW
jgi:uncharacterized protein